MTSVSTSYKQDKAERRSDTEANEDSVESLILDELACLEEEVENDSIEIEDERDGVGSGVAETLLAQVLSAHDSGKSHANRPACRLDRGPSLLFSVRP